MERQTIFETLAQIIRDVLKDDTVELTQQTVFADLENWDSMAHFMVITGAEKAFGIRFSLMELNQLDSVNAIIDSVVSKLS